VLILITIHFVQGMIGSCYVWVFWITTVALSDSTINRVFFDWVMLDFVVPDNDSDYPINAECGYYDQSFYPAKLLCLCKLLMEVYMQF